MLPRHEPAFPLVPEMPLRIYFIDFYALLKKKEKTMDFKYIVIQNYSHELPVGWPEAWFGVDEDANPATPQQTTVEPPSAAHLPAGDHFTVG